jgi:transmembrane sensor
MSGIVRLRTRAEIDEEAAEWTWRMDSATVTAAERQSFDAWLKKDRRHRRSYEELARVWHTLDGLAEARDDKIAALTHAGVTSRRPSRRRWWWAAAVVVVAVGSVTWWQRGRELQTLATAVGQRRNVTLADGSIVALNTNTIVETELNRRTREIYLRQGEAHFQVAHDRSRPFFVTLVMRWCEQSVPNSTCGCYRVSMSTSKSMRGVSRFAPLMRLRTSRKRPRDR